MGHMPGVVTTMGAVAGPSNLGQQQAGQYFVIGQSQRGPTDEPVLVTSLAKLIATFGARTTYSGLHDDLKTYFEEGGSRAWVQRVVGPGATTGKLASPLLDSANTPQPTLQIKANSPGEWSKSISVQVQTGAIDATRRLVVYVDGALAEDFTNLKSPAEFEQKITAQSRYIEVTDLASSSVGAQRLPAIFDQPLALTAGSDDRANLTSALMTAALAKFDKGKGDGSVAMPGMGPAAHEALVKHAADTNRIAILSAFRATDIRTLGSLAAAVSTRRGAERAGLYAPWIRVPDDYAGTRAIPPDGYVAAKRAKAHEATGPWQAWAGQISIPSYVAGPDQVFSPQDVEDLNDTTVNPIATLQGKMRIYGARSVSADRDNWLLLTGANTMNRIITQAESTLEDYVFGVIDGKGVLLKAIEGALEGIVKPIADVGGLFPAFDPADLTTITDNGYKIDTTQINEPLELATNTVYAVLSVRVAPTAELIRLNVTKASVTAAL
jgi:hypothetical protein